MNTQLLKYKVPLVLVTLLLLMSCRTYEFRSNYKDVNTLIHATKKAEVKPYLKAHLHNGDIVILKDSWHVDTVQNVITGSGIQYDYNRVQTAKGNLSIVIDSISIFETNRKFDQPEGGRIAALGIMAGIDVIIGITCLSNPKACFGSCPTFYTNENDNFHYADAEGFSNAILPRLEYYDIDALNRKVIPGKEFSITMKNEALETHCVNDVKLLAYPVMQNERVYQSPSNHYYLCQDVLLLKEAIADEGDITELLKSEDRSERFSLSDPENLASKEEIILKFDHQNVVEKLGLVAHFRQTMMSTYLIYGAMGNMGNQVSDFFAEMENSSEIKENLDNGLKKELGNIEVFIWNEKESKWLPQAFLNETGPIAINRQILPLTGIETTGEIKVKIVLNKGLWRIDYLGLTEIKEEVKPYELTANEIHDENGPNATAKNKIDAPNEYLISMPGDAYKFTFEMPFENSEYELFLYSKGYYLEWMRESWLKDKDLLKLHQLVYNPQKYLKEEAKSYKEYELQIEEDFWNSKIDTKSYSFYEN